jgi:four helix bundle protein
LAVGGWRLAVGGWRLAQLSKKLKMQDETSAGSGSGLGVMINIATVTDFRDFEAFKACRGFAREIGLLVRTRKFAPNRRLVDQMERASISVLSNFAEGFEWEGNSEFIQFLAISKGSVGELRVQLIYAPDLGLLPESQYDPLDLTAESATRLLGGLMRYLGGSAKRGRKYDWKPNRRRMMKPQASRPFSRSECGERRTANCKRSTANGKPPTANPNR